MDRVRVGVAGCGSVSEHYLADLKRSPFVDLVAVCDLLPERARRRADQFGVPHVFADAEAMLAGVDFDLFVNLTSMPAHFPLNRMALQAGRHVHSEKPFAGALEEGRALIDEANRRALRLTAAPNVVMSPAFRCIRSILESGEIGEVYAAHGRYGHPGPSWGPWFYRKGGGVVFDLAVYNLTFLTGLLGPATAVTAQMTTSIPEREIEGERVVVESEDNAMILLDHGGGALSSVLSGFVYGRTHEERTVELIGTKGCVNLLGWDWDTRGVEVASPRTNGFEVRCTDAAGYRWDRCGSMAAEWIATGARPAMTIEHALHVLEVMLAAKESAATGRRIAVGSAFEWPTPSEG